MKTRKFPVYLQPVDADRTSAKRERRFDDRNFGEIADGVEAQYGKNTYSDFLRKHGRYPDKAQAAAIGKLLGGRVRASDGSLQPPLSKADREALKAIKQRRKDWSRRLDHVYRLESAISALAANEDSPEQVLSYFQDHANSAVLLQLEAAVSWLNRFAEERRRHECHCPENENVHQQTMERWTVHSRNCNDNKKGAS
jgi:hypothetical protein